MGTQSDRDNRSRDRDLAVCFCVVLCIVQQHLSKRVCHCACGGADIFCLDYIMPVPFQAEGERKGQVFSHKRPLVPCVFHHYHCFGFHKCRACLHIFVYAVQGTALRGKDLAVPRRRIYAPSGLRRFNGLGFHGACVLHSDRLFVEAQGKSVARTLVVEKKTQVEKAARADSMSPLIREMTDNDILVDSSRMDEVVQIMKRLGYSGGEYQKDHDVVFTKPPSLVFEMHNRLFCRKKIWKSIFRFFTDINSYYLLCRFIG